MPKKRGDKKGQPEKAGKKVVAEKGTGNQSSVALVEHDDVGGAEAPPASGPVSMASFTGDESPDALRAQFTEKHDDAVEKIEDAKTSVATIATLKAVEVVSATLGTIQTVVDEMETIVGNIDAKKEAAEAAMESETITSDQMDELVELEDEYATAFRSSISEWSKVSEKTTKLYGKVGLAEDKVKASAADAAGKAEAEKELQKYRNMWGSDALAKGHYTKHKGDTGVADELEYYKKAAELNAKSEGGTIIRKTRKPGDDVLTMDTSTKEFTIMSAAGKIRTYFCPGGGKKYFDKQ